MLRKALIGIATAAVVLVPPATAVAAPPDTTTGPSTGRLLQELLDAEHEAGMPGVFAQVRDGRRSWNLAAGVADIDSGRPARPWMQQRVGSITKTFTSVVVLQLVGERKLRLDAPIARYLPGVVPGDLGRQVTVRMLLNHTSGLGDYDEALLVDYAAVEALRRRTVTPAELVQIGLSQPPTNAPGAAWSYSNTNYIVLGMLIEKLTGHRYAAEVNRRIIKPLKLRHTYLPGTNPYIRKSHMAAYVPWEDGSLRDLSVFNMSWAWAAGELISTADDLNRFYRALLTGKVLKPALLTEMKTTVPVDPRAPQGAGYGLGLFWMALPCGKVWGHNGAVAGQSTDSFHSADGRRQVTTAQNLNFIVNDAINAAHGRFLLAAACGPQPAAQAATA
ncbi:MAG TPA: serine hydrolase domain-containing protein, partial [Actinoplanes sp.]|nr:serine hydrolase domain-containing protein [Actinoplanes sp.]